LEKRQSSNQTDTIGQHRKNFESEVIDIVERIKAKSAQTPTEPEEDMVYSELVEPPMAMLEGIPLKYSDCTFDSFKGNDKLVETLKKIDQNESILLTGNTGCGKTHLAIALMKESKTDAMFISVPELLLTIRNSFRENSSESELEVVNRFFKYPTLILDDLGAEKTTEYAIATFYLIINRRINDLKRTIITTNLSLKDIESVFGARIASRLSEMRVIKINMPDYRKRKENKL